MKMPMKVTHKIRKRRNTIQRRKILLAVQKLERHATAEELYERLHVEMPEISLSTVYRNLKALADEGLVSVTDLGNGLVFEAVEGPVWSSGNTLRSILDAHDAVVDDPDPHPDKLERGAAARLRDVVGTFNQLAFADPALRRRDANRPGPQEHQRSISEINIVLEVAALPAADRTITNA